MDAQERIDKIKSGERHPADKYQTQFADELINHMRNGKSISSFQALLFDKFQVSITKQTLYNWRDRHGEFAQAMEIGKSMALNFFENLLTSAATGTLPKSLVEMKSKGINITPVIFALKTRFFKEYGESIKLQGNEEASPIKVEHTVDASKFSTDDLKTMHSIMSKVGNECSHSEKLKES